MRRGWLIPAPFLLLGAYVTIDAMKHTVTMLRTVFAAPDWINPRHYMKGRTYYDVPDHLMQQFIAEGAVMIGRYSGSDIEFDPVIESPENKMDNGMEKKRPGRPKGSKNESKRQG